jgi:hypothetical protein
VLPKPDKFFRYRHDFPSAASEASVRAALGQAKWWAEAQRLFFNMLQS